MKTSNYTVQNVNKPSFTAIIFMKGKRSNKECIFAIRGFKHASLENQLLI
ncbi:hypothetical protein SAMN05661099_1395 [Daejeonella lutea]|uniref:Uncharacterized protein n=1 Tax=Daejeonella lutea TaxID=572036 RepID=A0A1T5B840_9SPHI|nr:hypothetical protein SAMN05661099_1395 [Daejeonella lutea]